MFPAFLHAEFPSGHTFGHCKGSWLDGRQHSLSMKGRKKGREERKEEGRQARRVEEKMYPTNISDLGNLHQGFYLENIGSGN